MRAYDIIKKKRSGDELSRGELKFFIENYLLNEIPDYQMSAFLMAVYFKGLTETETTIFTELMLNSGKVLDFSAIKAPKVDKHSTGGVGDKTSIILAPLMAAAGVKVPMIAGRGLGHTGGTIDKLESIPNFRTDISIDEFKKNIEKIGCSIISQTTEIAPADKRLYALRDITATVESIPLITASIMSKKLAEGIDGLVLDVKTGSGAFMKTLDESKQLARAMVDVGNSMNVKTVAIITNMNQPLGLAVGNSLEMKECIEALNGNMQDDLKEVTITLGVWMEYVADCVKEKKNVSMLSNADFEKHKKELLNLIENGKAFEKFVEFVEAQHGNPDSIKNPALMPSAKKTKEIKLPSNGFIKSIDTEKVGIAAMLLGAGRQKAEEKIDLSAGIVMRKKIGDSINPDEPVCLFHYNDERNLKEAEEVFLLGIKISADIPVKEKLILDIII
jgi:pyrimidine-nucleoside phosphorylase